MSRKKITCLSVLLLAAVAFIALAYAKPLSKPKTKASRVNVNKNIVQRF
ncbi:MAG: hypothetical protein NTW03_18150 [Verrucomicrobia bacterium]|nr:hypothetical protein [Verrucomicrobiota bacterium]